MKSIWSMWLLQVLLSILIRLPLTVLRLAIMVVFQVLFRVVLGFRWVELLILGILVWAGALLLPRLAVALLVAVEEMIQSLADWAAANPLVLAVLILLSFRAWRAWLAQVSPSTCRAVAVATIPVGGWAVFSLAQEGPTPTAILLGAAAVGCLVGLMNRWASADQPQFTAGLASPPGGLAMPAGVALPAGAQVPAVGWPAQLQKVPASVRTLGGLAIGLAILWLAPLWGSIAVASANAAVTDPAFIPAVATPPAHLQAISVDDSGGVRVGQRIRVYREQLVGIFVVAVEPVATLKTGDDGSATIDLTPGTYAVRYFGSRGPWLHNVALTAGQITFTDGRSFGPATRSDA